jgi:3-phenylpropionate/trans-cinnamate dioxygenase ferredoxin reductase component
VTSSTDPVLIVGASLAGLRAAEALRRSGYLGPIKALGSEPYLPYNRPPLSKSMLCGEGEIEDLYFPIKESVADIEWLTETTASSLDVKAQVVTDLSGNQHRYSGLVIATGLRPKPLPVDSNGISGIHVLRTFDDAKELRKKLIPGVRVLILGSGFIGCEVAATASKAGCEVRVVSRAHEPIEQAVGHELSLEIKRRHQMHGVEFIKGASVFGLIGDGHVERVILDSGVIYDADLVVVAVGSIPNTEWLEGSGIDIDDGVLVDKDLRAVMNSGEILENVFAVGDVARYVNPLFDDVARRVEHWNLPAETGKHAGKVLAGTLLGEPAKDADLAPFAPLPSFWSDQYDMNILAFGMTYLADRSELVAGELDGECLFEYFKDDKLVGVCGIGMRPTIQSYRSRFSLA